MNRKRENTVSRLKSLKSTISFIKVIEARFVYGMYMVFTLLLKTGIIEVVKSIQPIIIHEKGIC